MNQTTRQLRTYWSLKLARKELDEIASRDAWEPVEMGSLSMIYMKDGMQLMIEQKPDRQYCIIRTVKGEVR